MVSEPCYAAALDAARKQLPAHWRAHGMQRRLCWSGRTRRQHQQSGVQTRHPDPRQYVQTELSESTVYLLAERATPTGRAADNRRRPVSHGPDATGQTRRGSGGARALVAVPPRRP